jgi:hypothetical protein
MTIAEVEERLDEATIAIPELQTEVNTKRRKLKSLSMEKTVANRQWKRGKHAANKADLEKSVVKLGAKKQALSIALDDLEAKLRHEKSVQYSANKLLQQNGAMSKQKPPDPHRRVVLPPETSIGTFDIETTDLSKHLEVIGQNGRIGATFNDDGHVFLQVTTAMGGKEMLEMASRFTVAVKNRYEVLETVASEDGQAIAADGASETATVESEQEATQAASIDGDENNQTDAMDVDDGQLYYFVSTHFAQILMSQIARIHDRNSSKARKHIRCDQAR